MREREMTIFVKSMFITEEGAFEVLRSKFSEIKLDDYMKISGIDENGSLIVELAELKEISLEYANNPMDIVNLHEIFSTSIENDYIALNEVILKEFFNI